MSNLQIIIHELASNPTYVYRDNTGAGSFDNYSTEAGTVAGTEFTLHADNADIMYFGKAAAFRSLGFRYHTAGSYGARDWEYWNGSAWTDFTPLHDSTAGFSAHGYVAWAALSGWASTTVNGQAAFWVRVKVASVTTAAKGYNFLRNLTFEHSNELEPAGPPIMFRDVNGTLRQADVVYTKPRELEVRCKSVSLAGRYGDVHLLAYWKQAQPQLYIQDGAQTATPDFQADAPYSDYTGYLRNYVGNIMSPAKMSVSGGFTLQFDIDAATAVFSP